MSTRLSVSSIRSLGFAALVVGALPCAVMAQTPSTDPSGDTPFSSMAIAPDQDELCNAPRPPIELGPTAYVRNGYRAILRIMAAKKWQETESCECYLTQIRWQEVVERSGEFVVSDDTRRPFDVSELRLLADALLAKRDQACAE
ncbi:hypothetical protein FIU97_20170 (plasmid) [Roseivivax sp. THAF40]|nr:hypothetical protein FIU97_20170 [Roseivivax sp. THAF40]